MFVRSHGSAAGVSDFVNKQTGESFTKLVFPNAKFGPSAKDSQGNSLEGKVLCATWGPSLAGGLTADQVAAKRNELVVLETDRPEHYVVCKQGELQTTLINVEW